MVVVVHCGMHGSGETKKEARADAEAKLKAVIDADYTPVYLAWKGNAILITRTSYDVQLRHVWGDQLGTGTCSYGWDGMDKAKACARLSLAQLSGDLDDDKAPDILGDNPELIRDYFSWLAWQRAYRGAPKDIPDGQIRHRWASDHAEEFRIAA